jgi:cysteinyl-tRNA synthetase
LELYNVRTRQKEPFRPLRPGQVGMYVCGLTVYDHAHIGHARTAVAFEVARRWLEHRAATEGWGRLTFVQNVTDVDDKIIARALEVGVSPLKHAADWDARCAAQMARLGVRPPDHAPHVTQNIAPIVRFIEAIVARGFAYATPEGSVYFDVPAYDAFAAREMPGCGYGSLSNRDFREMAAGTRKDVEGDKRHAADFALWKAAKPADHKDSSWDSPWGRGRPGWHIECSLMATAALGDTIDIHGGGQDLIFPHHENEVAQSQAKTGKAPFVQVWMHTGFLNVEGEKMSKSLGNFITLESMLDGLAADGTDPAALRFYFVQTQYRSKIDFSRKGLAEATTALGRLERTRAHLHAAVRADNPDAPDVDRPLADALLALEADFAAAMDDDLHTPGAIAALFAFQRWANTALDTGRLGAAAAGAALAAFERCGAALTLFDRPVQQAGGAVAPPPLVELVASLGLPPPADATESAAMLRVLEARAAARTARDWPRSDAIRAAVAKAGYRIEDTAQGPRWSRA